MRHRGGPVSPFQAPPERVERFRSTNRVGERISGTFLGWDGPGIGWVDFQGTRLLATMASRPEAGMRLYFLVKQLFPDIILQELSSSGLPGTFPLLQRLWAEQRCVETSLATLWAPAFQDEPEQDTPGATARDSAQGRTGGLNARLAAWRGLLDRHPRVRQNLHRLYTALEPINAELAVRGIGRFFALPWLSDRVRGAGLLLGGAPGHPGQPTSGVSGPYAVFTCTHPALGQMELHFALPRTQPDSHPDAHPAFPPGWTLHLDQAALPPRTTASISDWLGQAFPPRQSGPLAFHGLRSLPPGNHSELLPRLLLASAGGHPRLHIKV